MTDEARRPRADHAGGRLADHALERLADHARAWRVTVRRTLQTPTSLVAFGKRHEERVVLKVARAPGDEWRSGEVTAAFDGRGVVRVLEHTPGAVLLEELSPGHALAEVAAAGRDEEATHALAGVIAAMTEVSPETSGHPTAQEWGRAFDRYLATGADVLPVDLVEGARERYRHLCRTQRAARLLHGDLQHFNVLRGGAGGWTAIDPKGVVAELELELAAALRNPTGMPDLYASTRVAERRIEQFARELRLDGARIAEWAYAGAVLSAVWTVEDGGVPRPEGPALGLAAALRPLVGS